MRHLSFFQELASLDDGDASWRAVSAGLVFLRLVDAWVEEGSSVVAADGWGVRSVRAAIDEMADGLPERAILQSAMDALESSQSGDLHAVAPRLMAYARSLELDGHWTLSADVYDTVIGHLHPDEESEIVVNALLRRGHCLRSLGELAEASGVFGTAADLAHQHGDMMGLLRARIGEAKIIVARGNMPAADELLRETIDHATANRLLEVRSMATHERAYIAHTTGQYDLAVRFAYDALRDSASEVERDRILADLAASFYMLGVKSAARDAFLILAATGREQWQRWTATMNLMELAAEDGIEVQFERYRSQLASAKLPPLQKGQFEMEAGRGYLLLDDRENARVWLNRALETASSHRFNQLVFAIESELKNLKQPISRPTPVTNDIPRELEMIAADLKERRRLAAV